MLRSARSIPIAFYTVCAVISVFYLGEKGYERHLENDRQHMLDAAGAAADAYKASSAAVLRATEKCASLFENMRDERRFLELADSCATFNPLPQGWLVVSKQGNDGSLTQIYNGLINGGRHDPIPFSIEQVREYGMGYVGDKLLSQKAFLVPPIYAPILAEKTGKRTLVGATMRGLITPHGGKLVLGYAAETKQLMPSFSDLDNRKEFYALLDPRGRIAHRIPDGPIVGMQAPDATLEAIKNKPEGGSISSVEALKGTGSKRVDIAFQRVSGTTPKDSWYLVYGRESERFLNVIMQDLELFAIGIILLTLPIFVFWLHSSNVTDRALAGAASRIAQAERENSRRKTLLLEGMSHEIRSPLVSLMGGIELVESSANIDELKDALVSAQASAAAVLQVADEVLDMAQLATSAVKLVETPAFIHDICEEVCSSLKTQALQKSIKFRHHIPTDGPLVMVDRTRLSRAIANILNNAIKFTERGAVNFSLTTQSDIENRVANYSIEIRDTGCGMEEDEIALIFDEFYSQSEARGVRGTGLGLSITKHFIEAMNGEISVQSSPQMGTRFVINLSLRFAHKITEKQDSPTDILVGKRILIAEDEGAILKATVRRLQREGATCLVARNGAEAIAIAQNTPSLDFALLDIEMPTMSGIEAAKKIKASSNLSTLPVFGLTSHIRGIRVEEARDAGMTTVFVKPLQLDALKDFLAYSLTRKASGALFRQTKKKEDVLLDADTFADITSLETRTGQEHPFQQFLRTLKNQQLEIQEALAAEDRNSAIRSTHSLAGLCMVFGASKLGEELRFLEDTLREGTDLEKAKQDFQNCIYTMKQTRIEMIAVYEQAGAV